MLDKVGLDSELHGLYTALTSPLILSIYQSMYASAFINFDLFLELINERQTDSKVKK